MNYYNENDPYAAEWLNNLIGAGHLPMGFVDTRSIAEVQPEDLAGFTQCHFFAGIGGWPYALQLAGWPEDKPVWTGSCPCQPFSVAGSGKGVDDERHLWPELFRLIALSEPDIVFGEQVESKAGREWLAGVQIDLEALGFAFGAADLGAACVGAPHRRQRLYWVAESEYSERRSEYEINSDAYRRNGSGRCGDADGLAVAERAERRTHSEHRADDQYEEQERRQGAGRIGACSESGSVDHSAITRLYCTGQCQCGSPSCASRPLESGCSDAWSDFSLIPCLDGKTRRVKSGLQPLAHGVPARMGRLRGYGNAIVPQVAATFVRSYLDILDFTDL